MTSLVVYEQVFNVNQVATVLTRMLQLLPDWRWQIEHVNGVDYRLTGYLCR